MKLFSLSYRQRKKISKSNVVVYSYDYGGNEKKATHIIPASSRIELWFRNNFLDTN